LFVFFFHMIGYQDHALLAPAVIDELAVVLTLADLVRDQWNMDVAAFDLTLGDLHLALLVQGHIGLCVLGHIFILADDCAVVNAEECR
jgi:hypothetical protein